MPLWHSSHDVLKYHNVFNSSWNEYIVIIIWSIWFSTLCILKNHCGFVSTTYSPSFYWCPGVLIKTHQTHGVTARSLCNVLLINVLSGNIDVKSTNSIQSGYYWWWLILLWSLLLSWWIDSRHLPARLLIANACPQSTSHNALNSFWEQPTVHYYGILPWYFKVWSQYSFYNSSSFIISLCISSGERFVQLCQVCGPFTGGLWLRHRPLLSRNSTWLHPGPVQCSRLDTS